MLEFLRILLITRQLDFKFLHPTAKLGSEWISDLLVSHQVARNRQILRVTTTVPGVRFLASQLISDSGANRVLRQTRGLCVSEQVCSCACGSVKDPCSASEC